ncbi:hypothetical protein N431DRAFT_232089 [Stipitochalara longipes BDJ]|nr:hypothetical protein N431DRAFT_232089 [Stipitochalara longipes BDJ]
MLLAGSGYLVVSCPRNATQILAYYWKFLILHDVLHEIIDEDYEVRGRSRIARNDCSCVCRRTSQPARSKVTQAVAYQFNITFLFRRSYLLSSALQFNLPHCSKLNAIPSSTLCILPVWWGGLNASPEGIPPSVYRSLYLAPNKINANTLRCQHSSTRS